MRTTTPRADRIDSAIGRSFDVPLTLVTGGPGWGKSSLLQQWSGHDRAVLVRRSGLESTPVAFGRRIVESVALLHPEVRVPAMLETGTGRGPDAESVASDLAELVASAVAEALDEQLDEPVLLLIDQLDDLPIGLGATVLALARQAPEALHLVVAARSATRLRVARLRAEGRLREFTPAQLGFTIPELGLELDERLGPDGRQYAEQLHGLTNGWPLAVELVLSSLAHEATERRAGRIEALAQPGSPLVELLLEEGFAQLDDQQRQVIALSEIVPRINQRFCRAVGLDVAPSVVVALAESALFLIADPDEHGWFRTTGLAGAALEAANLGPLLPRLSSAELADAYVRVGHIEGALAVWSTRLHEADTRALMSFVIDHADTLVEHADADRLQRVLDHLGIDHDPAVGEAIGQLAFRRGDWERALEAFDRCEHSIGHLPARLGARLAQIHYLRGQIGQALAVCERATLGEGDRAADAQLLAWWSSALWLRNDVEACAAKADEAFVAATESRDDQALATAHTVLAMLAALRSDRGANDLHYLRALDHAKRAGDVLAILRVRSNRGSRFIEEGRYDDALAELHLGIEVGETSGFGTMLTIGLVNRGEAYHALGRLEDAMSDLRRALDVATRIGSLEVSYATLDLAMVHLDRGEVRQARTNLSQALSMAEPEGDLQAMVPALTGLARVALHEDRFGEGQGIGEARALIDRALVGEASLDYPSALAVSGRIALVEGDRSRAFADGTRAAEIASTRRDRAGLARAYEVLALASDPFDAELAVRAIGIWRDIRNPIGECGAELVRAEIHPELAETITQSVQDRAAQLGARRLAREAEQLRRDLGSNTMTGVEVRALGQFVVLRDGGKIPPGAWQSKKARDLFKILLSQRFGRIGRDQLVDLLWPDVQPEKAQRKLSVALSTARSVLDPDKAQSSDHFIGADSSTVWVERDNMRTDVGLFLDLTDRGEDAETSELERALSLYRGPYLEDDPYEDWTIGMREHCRVRQVDVCRSLARRYEHAGATDRALVQWLGIVDRDPYDEAAHLAIVRLLSGQRRHGEARRAYRRYAGRMAELDIEAATLTEAIESNEKGN